MSEHTRTIEHGVRRAYALRRSPEEAVLTEQSVALRLCTVHDDCALAQLAELEGRPLPRGRFVLAEVDGVLVAAQPLDGSLAFADPFRATAQLLPLLRLRARQLAACEPRRRFLGRRWSIARS
jgi:hypothetical protein